MFFDDVSAVREIAGRSGCSVFVVPSDVAVEVSGAIILQPEEKTVITIDQVHDVMERLKVRQTSDIYIMMRPAESLSEPAANALLKNLEEPGDKVHFILVTDEPSRLMPTILSRAAVYFLRTGGAVDGDVHASAPVRDLAKRLIVAKGADYVALAEEIAKKKDGVRGYALEVLAVAIEMLQKSYYKTEREVFARKLPKFLAAYDAIERNGHVKLHLVADLV